MITSNIVNNDPLLDQETAAAYIDQNPDTLANQRSMRTGPTYIKIGRLVRYRKSDLDAYIESGVVQTNHTATERKAAAGGAA